ncbi:MAG: hypothetical protein WAT81_04970 [Candidatus Moraniibacteriota bacterium]
MIYYRHPEFQVNCLFRPFPHQEIVINVQSFPSAVRSFGISALEVMHATCRGLARAVAYAAYATSPYEFPRNERTLDYVRLCSAVEHFSRKTPVLENIFGESYIDRVNRADTAMLTEVLEELGLIMTDVTV